MSTSNASPIFSSVVFRPDDAHEFPMSMRPQVSEPGYSDLQDAFASLFAEHMADPTEVRVHQADRAALERVLTGMPWAAVAAPVGGSSTLVINLTTGGQVEIVVDPQVPQGTAVIAGDRRPERWVW